MAFTQNAFSVLWRQCTATLLAFEGVTDRTKVADTSIRRVPNERACAGVGRVNATAMTNRHSRRAITCIDARIAAKVALHNPREVPGGPPASTMPSAF